MFDEIMKELRKALRDSLFSILIYFYPLTTAVIIFEGLYLVAKDIVMQYWGLFYTCNGKIQA
jgi:hypothetical protein